MKRRSKLYRNLDKYAWFFIELMPIYEKRLKETLKTKYEKERE